MKKNFTQHHNLKKKGIPFFDIPIENDSQAFICPFLIENNKDKEIINRVYLQISSFLTTLNRNFISKNDRTNGLNFLSHLHEPNEYPLGYSDRNKGMAVSDIRSSLIFNALRSNKLAKQGLNITNEANNVLLLVKGIGQDIMSDIIANVCRNIFAEFTQEICLINQIETKEFIVEYYDINTLNWTIKTVNLPFLNNKEIILIPKEIVSGSREYSNLYNWFIAKNYISLEILKEKPSPKVNKFVIQLKNNSRKAIIKKVYEVYRKPKNELIDFVIKYKGSLDDFIRYAKENYPALQIESIVQ